MKILSVSIYIGTNIHNENIQLEFFTQNSTELLLETDGDNIIGEDDTTSIGESILLENNIDTGQPQYLISDI